MRLPASFQRFDTANLRLRVLSSLFMLPVVLLTVYLGGWAFGALVTVAVTLGFYEWLRLVAPQAQDKVVGLTCAMLGVMIVAGALFSAAFGAMLGVVFTLAVFVLAARDQGERAGWMALGIPYMGGSGLALLDLRLTPQAGMGLVFYLLVTVWGTDIGAYVAGRLIGGAKLAPAISPSKTWAGLIGGMVLALLLGWLAASLLGARQPWVALLLSPILACVAQLGDLFESYFKRRSGVKESGDLIPGHGGVLDRIDGLVFAGVFMFLFQSAIGLHIEWF